MTRFDDCVRSERYFTATLLPLVLLHADFAGLRAFVELIESRVGSEHDLHGTQRGKAEPTFDFSDPEVITEFHIARDLHHYGARLAAPDAEAAENAVEKRDVPDLVIVLGREMIVIEAKFFGNHAPSELQAQLRSQKRQVRHLFETRPSLRAWRHVALVPELIPALDCDAVITWDSIADLSRAVLGPTHYVTRRLENAVARYPHATSGRPGLHNFESKLTLADALELCRREGNTVSIGHWGGEADLRARGTEYAQAKHWKWRRTETEGTIDPANWIPGARFPLLVASLGAASPPASAQGSRVPNFDGVLDYDEMVSACRRNGGAIHVGHTGGESDLIGQGLAYARGKRWKWRDPRANRGVVEPANWIPGDRFASLTDRLR